MCSCLLTSRRGAPSRCGFGSAACATGEEPLTIAMALNEAGWFERAPIEIYASDASSQALEKARRGVYRERSFRNLSPELRAKYFTEEQGLWRVAPELSARIKWTKANLMEKGEIALLATTPIIFCRNVFIYFSADAIGKVGRPVCRTDAYSGAFIYWRVGVTVKG